ncbi:MAG: hypothetical protein R3E39_04645 [Anaerolineae bacterium]
MSFRHLGTFQPRPWFTEISSPSAQGSSISIQPFMGQERASPLDLYFIYSLKVSENWENWFSAEQSAYALAQVQAALALPSLTEFASVAALLECRVNFRTHLDDTIVEAITKVLISRGASINWNRVDSVNFASVVGAGVAACVDITSGGEVLYLRFANDVATAITKAKREAELPQSLQGLETLIRERIDELLAYARPYVLAKLCKHPTIKHSYFDHL